MVYTAVRRRISRELSDDIDDWHVEINRMLEPKGIRLSKEDVSMLMSLKLRNDRAKNINLFAVENHRSKTTHRLEPDLMNMDINEFLDMQVSDLIKRLNLVKV